MLAKKEILITGGTGTLGKALIRRLQLNHNPRGIRVYSRDEAKQAAVQRTLKAEGLDKDVAFIIGDVKNRLALERACMGVDIIINCAAMKRVDTAEDNPLECEEINVGGAKNVVNAALENKVHKVFHISTDKAVYPTTLYGQTKAVAESIITHANVYRQKDGPPMFSCARYGNVFGSRGSVIHTFREQAKKGVLTVTDPQMTRFWITVDDVAKFVLDRIFDMRGGEIFVPNMPSMAIVDMAKTIAPEAEIKFIGIRGNEKLHECLITEEESIYMKQMGDDKKVTHFTIDRKMEQTSERWSFCSGDNPWQLTRDELRKMLEEL